MCSKYQQAMIDAYLVFNNFVIKVRKSVDNEKTKIMAATTDITRPIGEAAIKGMEAMAEASIAAARVNLDTIIDMISAEAKKAGQANVQ